MLVVVLVMVVMMVMIWRAKAVFENKGRLNKRLLLYKKEFLRHFFFLLPQDPFGDPTLCHYLSLVSVGEKGWVSES